MSRIQVVNFIELFNIEYQKIGKADHVQSKYLVKEKSRGDFRDRAGGDLYEIPLMDRFYKLPRFRWGLIMQIELGARHRDREPGSVMDR